MTRTEFLRLTTYLEIACGTLINDSVRWEARRQAQRWCYPGKPKLMCLVDRGTVIKITYSQTIH